MVITNGLECPMHSHYVIYYEQFRNVMQQTEKEALNTLIYHDLIYCTCSRYGHAFISLNFYCVYIIFTIDKYYYVFLKCVNKDIIIIIIIIYHD